MKKLICVMSMVLLLGAIILIVTLTTDSQAYDNIIQHDFTDLSYIESLSKFRSGAGHDYNDGTETNLSMKHYFQPYSQYSGQSDSDQLIPIYAPFSGYIIRVQDEDHILSNGERRGKQLGLVPLGYTYDSPEYYEARIFHVNLLDSYPQNYSIDTDSALSPAQVTAGDLLGYADIRLEGRNFDIAMLYRGTDQARHLISYFDVMPDTIFADYVARGVGSRDELILSKEYRDANPVTWWGNYNPDDWVRLSAQPVVTPEPASMILFGLGGAAMAFGRRRMNIRG